MLEWDLLKKVLQTLSNPKFLILLKTGDKTALNDQDEFYVNEDFSSKLLRFTLPVIEEKDKFAKEKVELDRSGAVEAAIVKLLKARKSMNHNEIISEVLIMLSTFKPTTWMIKERIAHLIQREYIERDKDDNNLYHYNA